MKNIAMKTKLISYFLMIFLLGCQSSGYRNQIVDVSSDREKVEEIFNVFDMQMKGSDEYLKYLEDDVILMAHNVPEINGKEDYMEHIKENRSYGITEIEHKLIELYPYKELVIARGKAIGTFQANNSQDKMPFETKNMFVFRRLANGELSVWQTIFNMNP